MINIPTNNCLSCVLCFRWAQVIKTSAKPIDLRAAPAMFYTWTRLSYLQPVSSNEIIPASVRDSTARRLALGSLASVGRDHGAPG